MRPPPLQVQRVFKSPGMIGLKVFIIYSLEKIATSSYLIQREDLSASIKVICSPSDIDTYFCRMKDCGGAVRPPLPIIFEGPD